MKRQLLYFFLPLMVFVSAVLPLFAQKVDAQIPPDIINQSNQVCATIAGRSDGAAFSTCVTAYRMGYAFSQHISGAKTEAQQCPNNVVQSYCKQGYEAGFNHTSPGSSDATLAAEIAAACGDSTNSNSYNSCKQGVIGASKGQSQSDSCNGASDQNACKQGWQIEQTRIKPTAASQAAQNYCASHKNDSNVYGYCLVGYDSGHGNAPNNSVCANATGTAKTVCQQAFTQGGNDLQSESQKAGNGGTTPQDPEGQCESSANVFNFGWIACPMLAAVDDFVGVADSAIQSQLNFDTAKYLDNNVHKSWTIMKDIATSLLVIIMLVMVIGQALSGGA